MAGSTRIVDVNETSVGMVGDALKVSGTIGLPANAAKETGGNLDNILNQLTAMRTTMRKTLAVAGVVDGGEVQVTGLTPSQAYELRCFRSTNATTGGAATHRQRALYEATGGAVANLAWQEAAALAIADGISIPFTPGPILRSDAGGKLWLRYAVTGAGDITETVIIDLVPLIGV